MSKRSTRRLPAVPPVVREARHAMALPDPLKYTRFRSQLEIRFALELEQRGIRWFYEPERLGEGKYLLDFYLPDCRSWVEVKGVVRSRDHLVLRQVAAQMWTERNQRVYMWTATRAYLVTAGDFKPTTHEAFWAALGAAPNEKPSQG